MKKPNQAILRRALYWRRLLRRGYSQVSPRNLRSYIKWANTEGKQFLRWSYTREGERWVMRHAR